MRYGLTAFLGPYPDPRGWVELARELGLRAIELRAEPGFAHPDELGTGDRRWLRRVLAGLEVSLHVALHDLNPASLVPRVATASVAEISSCIDLAADLGAGVLVLHPGYVPEDQPSSYRGRAEAQMAFALQVLADKAHRHGVRLALENKQRGRGDHFVHTADQHAAWIDRVPGLTACVDVGHLHTLGLDPQAYLRFMGGRVAHVHLHDNRGAHDEHLALGDGTVPWPQVFASLDELGYEGTSVLELPTPEAVRTSLQRLSVWGGR